MFGVIRSTATLDLFEKDRVVAPKLRVRQSYSLMKLLQNLETAVNSQNIQSGTVKVTNCF